MKVLKAADDPHIGNSLWLSAAATSSTYEHHSTTSHLQYTSYRLRAALCQKPIAKLRRKHHLPY